MALFDKFNKDDLLSKAKSLGEKATDLAKKAGDSAKTAFDDAKTSYEEKKEQKRLAKLPQEGGLQRYEVTYRGGHPEYPMSKEINKYPYIIMDVMPDRFSFLPKDLSKPWFPGFELPYTQVVSIELVERTISTTESLLGSGSDNSDLRQKNVMEITYIDENGDEYVMRNEMLSGVTVMGQARVCLEMMDLLRGNKILKLFRGKGSVSASAPQIDTAEQLKKFKDLLDNGIITQEEFDVKKKQLLGL